MPSAMATSQHFPQRMPLDCRCSMHACMRVGIIENAILYGMALCVALSAHMCAWVRIWTRQSSEDTSVGTEQCMSASLRTGVFQATFLVMPQP